MSATTLPREPRAPHATTVYGSAWRTRPAKERGIAIRTVQRRAKDGIAKLSTAAGCGSAADHEGGDLRGLVA